MIMETLQLMQPCEAYLDPVSVCQPDEGEHPERCWITL
jgi:hypothetical protein